MLGDVLSSFHVSIEIMEVLCVLFVRFFGNTSVGSIVFKQETLARDIRKIDEDNNNAEDGVRILKN